MADHSPTAGPDTGAPISTATARMITDAWLAQQQTPPTLFLRQPDSDMARSCRPGEAVDGFNKAETNRDENTGVKLNLGARGTLGGRQMLLSAANIMMHT
ncbi:hypothetical protein PBY51_014088 [Eleginops maclovinus]|uniref:Uncharacterized protein n=1 Tax=Eleginops maclovinus TaxID=56733 RepID=A0AAN7WV15_ELEMC|nr:hypothetical protein PBY51_014088 [Eleginops maclovinus]